MAISLIMTNNGKIYDLTNLCENEIILTTTIYNSSSNLKFTLALNPYDERNLNFEEGDEVLLYAEKKGIFRGYIFQKQAAKENSISILAYDQTRYLKNRDSFLFRNITASDIFKNICSKFKINTGEIDNTGYVIPNLVKDNATLWSVFKDALDITKSITNQNYVIYDDFGKLMLKNVKNLSVPLFFSSDDKTMIDYNYKTDIDSNTFNRIKLFKHNRDDNVCYAIAETEAESVNKWGVLQYSEIVDDEMNSAQAAELAKKILEAKNKINSRLSVIDFGDINIRAGVNVRVKINYPGGVINSSFYVKECIHTFKNNLHTMKLELTDEI